MKTPTELRNEKATVLDSIKTLRAKATDKPGEFSAEDQTALASALSKVAEIDTDINAAEQRRDLMAQADAAIGKAAATIHTPAEPGKPPVDVTVSGRTLASRRARAIFGNDTKRAQDAGDWFKSRFLATSTTVTNTSAGYLVPDAIQADIIKLREERGTFRQYARVIQMTAPIIKVPRWRSGLTVYYPGEAPSSAITESNAAFDRITIEPKTYSILTKWSMELAQDSAIDFAALMVDNAAYAFADAEDNNAFNGTGTSTYAGVRGIMSLATDSAYAGSVVTAGSGETAPETIKIDTLLRMISTLPDYARNGAAWYCSPTIASILFYRAKLSSSGALAAGNTADTITGQMVPTFLGYPIRTSRRLYATAGAATSTVILFFGDLGMASTLGDRGNTMFQLNERFADTNEIALVANQRVAIVNHELGDTTNAGPLLWLKTAGS